MKYPANYAPPGTVPIAPHIGWDGVATCDGCCALYEPMAGDSCGTCAAEHREDGEHVAYITLEEAFPTQIPGPESARNYE